MMPHRWLSYTVDYLAADGRRRGTEACHVTVHGDGVRTQRARSEIFDSRVLRDVVLTVDAAYRPVDALVRVTVDDRFVGAGFFRFGDGFAECEAHTAREGRISQRMETASRPVSFISHAVTGDVWHGAGIAKDPAAGAQPLPTILSCSPLHNGASGPYLVPWPLRATFVGHEDVETPAGRFRAERIRYEEPTGELFLDTWCTADGDRVMLRMHYPPYDSSYVLTSLCRG
jgi:hypothetical protein